MQLKQRQFAADEVKRCEPKHLFQGYGYQQALIFWHMDRTPSEGDSALT